jgi:hypothetical protein
MPYNVGEKGSFGCSGFPALKEDGTVMGCHATAEAAANQIYAINESENNVPDKGVGIRDPDPWPGTRIKTDGAMGQPFPASNRSSVFRKPRTKPRRSVGGVGGSSSGAVATTGGGSGMGTKTESEEDMMKPITETSEFQSETDTRDSIARVIGKDYTKSTRLTEIFKAESVSVGQMVSWNSSGGTARGKVRRVIRSGSYNVPGTDVTINGTEEDPAAVITLYRDGEATDITVGHRVSTLRAS